MLSRTRPRACLIVALIGLIAHITHARAADTTTPAENRLTIENAKEKSPPPQNPDDDVDTLITNPKMRAESGSKSKYSIATSANYSGGSLKQPFGDTRPNITGATGTTDFPTLGGSVSAKWNMSKRSSLMGGVGLRWVAPLAGEQTPKGYEGKRVDADNPYLVYQYLYRMGALQSAVQLRETFFTASDRTREGFLTNWAVSQNSMYDIGMTGISVGFNTYVGAAIYNKHEPEFKKGQSDYSFGFSPAAEYRLTDKLNLHVDTNLFIYEHLRSANGTWTFRRQEVSQNFSVGYAITRDLFISPGVSFVASNLRLERTTWSLNANINLF